MTSLPLPRHRARLAGALLCAVACLPALLGAQGRKAPPTRDSLDAITARGRQLARHDAAAWRATDVLLAHRPDTARMGVYVVRQHADSSWSVAFGKLAADSGSLLVAYELRAPAARPDSFTFVGLDPVRTDTGYHARAARAMLLARQAFGPADRPYVISVIPADGGDWWVYATPAVTRRGAWPLGADRRYRVSADGRRVLAERQMHRAIITFGPFPPDRQPEAGTQATILDDIPEDTDVFHVLQRTPRVPQIMVTDAFIYQIGVDGGIRLVGRREEILGR